jgi:hypothetical protein
MLLFPQFVSATLTDKRTRVLVMMQMQVRHKYLLLHTRLYVRVNVVRKEPLFVLLYYARVFDMRECIFLTDLSSLFLSAHL